MSVTNRDLLIYTAGFFDADGCVEVYWGKTKDSQRGGQFRLIAQITQKHWLPIFEEWYDCWGGSLTHRRTREGWAWTLNTKRAALFLKDILPYLRNKRDQAELAIRFQERKKQRGGKGLSDAEFEWQRTASEALKDMKRTSEAAPSGLLAQIERQVAELGQQLGLWRDREV